MVGSKAPWARRSHQGLWRAPGSSTRTGKRRPGDVPRKAPPPSLDGFQGQSRQVQKVDPLLGKKIIIFITAQHFLVDQSPSKKVCFGVFRTRCSRHPSLFLVSCPCFLLKGPLAWAQRKDVVGPATQGGEQQINASSTSTGKDAKVLDQGEDKCTSVLFV